MKTSKLIITCVTTLILAALIAYATRYTYFKDGEHTMRTNRYSGQVCYLGTAQNPRWQPVPQSVLDSAIKNLVAEYAAIDSQSKQAQSKPHKASVLDSIKLMPESSAWADKENRKQALEAATGKWNAMHNADLSETVLGWRCQ